MAAPRAVFAQQPVRLRKIVFLSGTAENDPQTQSWTAGFERGLDELGWAKGRNIEIEYRGGHGDLNRLRTLAADLAKEPPDVILALGTTATNALKRAGVSAPVVFAVVNDPVAQGIVPSMAKPDGNITGFSLMDYSVLGKAMELLHLVAPRIERVSLLFNPETYPYYDTFLKSTEIAHITPLQVSGLRLRSAAEIEPGVATLSGAGLVVAPDTFNNVNRTEIIRATAKHGIPATYPYRQFVLDGGLMAYGPDPADIVRRSASYIDRILKGAKPAELPVQAATKFGFLINAKTARTLGLQVPPNLLFTADEVIE